MSEPLLHFTRMPAHNLLNQGDLMHTSAQQTAQQFFAHYVTPQTTKLLDIGSLDWTGSIKTWVPDHVQYVGMDQQDGPGVDVVVEDPHVFPFESDHFDLITSTSCFEHDDMFWLTFLECVRVLKPGGYLYVNAPSNGCYHACPTDNWRFYPDSGLSLVKWGRRMNQPVHLIESFFTAQAPAEEWNDMVMVFGKGDPVCLPARMMHDADDRAFNIRCYGEPQMKKFCGWTEDQDTLLKLRRKLGRVQEVLNAPLSF